MANDPFATAFGDDHDNDHDHDHEHVTENVDTTRLDTPVSVRFDGIQAQPPLQRDKENGVLSFHNGTEHALLLFVQQAVKDLTSLEANQSNPNLRQLVLQAIDTFCLDRHWMMHVGPEKGRIVQDFLTNQITQYYTQQQQQQQEQTYNIVELGTYCGYSTIRIADTLLRHHNHKIVPKFHIHTVDINAQSQNIAKQMIKLAGLEQHVSFILREATTINQQPSDLFLDQLKDSIRKQSSTTAERSAKGDDCDNRIDFLFIDHAKEMYLSDVQLLESSGLIRQGTAVAADNVVFFQLSDYCNYMSQLQTRGIVRSELVTDNIYLEYTTPPPSVENHELRDGLELTVYLRDPI
jgi:catechol O-methyltransferase